jgi:uncharacterized protein YegL
MKIIKQKFVVDRSGSMSSQRDTIISGFNEQIETMKQEEKEKDVQYLVSLTLFSNKAEIIYKDKPLSEVQLFNHETYKTGGWTALNDAIVMTIDSAKLGETDTIITIMTDGHENASKMKKAGVKALIKIRQEENKWGFVYFGANVDAWDEAAQYGISNAVQYTETNTNNAIHAMASCRSIYTSNALNNSYVNDNLTANINKEELVK